MFCKGREKPRILGGKKWFVLFVQMNLPGLSINEKVTQEKQQEEDVNVKSATADLPLLKGLKLLTFWWSRKTAPAGRTTQSNRKTMKTQCILLNPTSEPFIHLRRWSGYVIWFGLDGKPSSPPLACCQRKHWTKRGAMKCSENTARNLAKNSSK